MFNRPRNSAKESLCSIVEDNIELIKYSYLSSDRFTLHNFCLKLSHATCGLQYELYCVNQAHNSLTTMKARCVLDLHSTTQVVSRLHATVLGRNCVV